MKLSLFGRTSGVTLYAACFVLAGVSGARVDAVYTSNSFEPPTFAAPVALEGQNGWQKDGGTSTASISTNNSKTALQSLQVLKAATSTSNTRWSVATPFTPSATLNALSADVDMRVNLSGTSFGPAFGLEVRDGSKLVGAFSVDAATGEVLYVETGTGDLLSTGKTVSRGV